MSDSAIAQQTAVEFADVGFSYPGRGAVFEHLSMRFEPGAFYLISGPSGAGKSTLLRLVNRLEEPDSGEIRFDGRPLGSFHPPVLRRSILYIQQTPTAIEGSVRDNLLLPFSLKSNRHLRKPDDPGLAGLLLDFGLDSIGLDDSAQSLSVGELQRVCFIRGLLLSPKVVLLDEPTSALDAKSARIVESRAERLCAEYGQTVVMVSHRGFEPEQVTPVALEIADRKVLRR